MRSLYLRSRYKPYIHQVDLKPLKEFLNRAHLYFAPPITHARDAVMDLLVSSEGRRGVKELKQFFHLRVTKERVLVGGVKGRETNFPVESVEKKLETTTRQSTVRVAASSGTTGGCGLIT